MRMLLSTLIVLPALALAQAEPPVPPAPKPERPVRSAPPLRAGMPVQSPQPTPSVAPALPAQPATQPPTVGNRPSAPRQGSQPPREAVTSTAATVADSKCVPLRGRFLLAINKADIVDVLEQASRWTCRNFAYTDEAVRGKITLLSKTPVTTEEAYAAFLAALTANGIAIYPSGRYYKLVRIADAKKVPIPTLLQDGSEAPATEQPVTKVLRLHYTDADQLRGVLGNFTSPQGADIQSIPPDVLILTDIGLNVRRIERIVDAIDRPGAGDMIRVVQVLYAPVRDVADKVNQVFAQQPAGPGRASRRTLIGGVSPGQPAPAPGAPAATQPTEISISKVLADERTNKLIVIADDKSYQRILELVKQLDVPTSGEGGIHVVPLKNANAEDLAQTLQALAQGQSSTRRGTGGTTPAAFPARPGVPTTTPGDTGARTAGTTAELFSGEVKITADKPTNSLVIMASAPDFSVVTRLIDKLDRPRRQVFVEAVIMEVNITNAKQFGVGMHAAIPYSTSDGTGFIPLASEPGRVNSLGGLTSFVGLGGFLTGLQGPVSAELKDILPSGVTSLAVYIQALQTSTDVNVLSTPHILASDNEESEIAVGQNVPFQSGFAPQSVANALSSSSGSSTASSVLGLQGLSGLYAPIQRQNVELRLKIKPQIGEGDTVRFDLEEQTEDIASTDQVLGPTTNKRSVKTKIVARDQSTVVIGGLIQDRTEQSVRKIPVLGDIPILGWLFRDTVTGKRKTNLLLFLTPYIIRDQSDFRRILERKRKEQQEFTEAFYGRQPGYQVPVDYARKPGPYARMHQGVEIETQKLDNGGPGAPGEHLVRPPQDRVAPPNQTEPTPAPKPVSPGAPGAQPTGRRPPPPEPAPEAEGELEGAPAESPGEEPSAPGQTQ
jgi:general secretion pathway protein D